MLEAQPDSGAAVPVYRLMELRESLREWNDADGAAYELGILLGIIKPDANFQTGVKWIFWSNNPTGNFLFETLQSMVRLGVLEYREDSDFQFRWNAQFESFPRQSSSKPEHKEES